MKTFCVIMYSAMAIMTSACDGGGILVTSTTSTSATASSGSGTGGDIGTGGGGGASGPSSSTTTSAGTGDPCSEPCPVSMDPCLTVECVDGSCLLLPVQAGATCEAFGHADKCNGGGVCGMVKCAADFECGPAPKCFSLTCPDDGDFAGECVATKSDTDSCGEFCAPELTGPLVAECASFGATSYYCARDGGPMIANVKCQRLHADDHPNTWCCDL